MNSVPTHSTKSQDHYFMQQAFAQAESVLYITGANPRVGCVIVADGHIIGQGATSQTGGPHAEVMAIRDAQKNHAHKIAGSTFYVTLEPCSHFGRTPPCADALVNEKPARVVVALTDPNPLVAGKGIAKLKAAGIKVDFCLDIEKSLDINSGFFSRIIAKCPWVWSKVACSLDGKVALNNGQSQWITSALARADGHHWRARSGLILTGSGTVKADNPSLTVREVQSPRAVPKAVIDSRFDIDENAILFDGGLVYCFVAIDNEPKAQRLAAKNVQVIKTPVSDEAGHIDLSWVMHYLAQHEVNEVHIEAGGALNGALLKAGLIDEWLVYMAPKVLGEAIAFAQLPALNQLQDAYCFEWIDSQLVGSDMRLRLVNRVRREQIKAVLLQGLKAFTEL